MCCLAVGLFRRCIMAKGRRKRARNSSRRSNKTVMEKRLSFSVMDGHRTLRYEPIPIVMKNRYRTVAVVVLGSRCGLSMNWLRVFGNAEASRMGQGGGQQHHTRAERSEKWWDSVAAYGAGMRVIAAFFGPSAPEALPSHVSVFSHDFKRFERLTKLATSSSIMPSLGKSGGGP